MRQLTILPKIQDFEFNLIEKSLENSIPNCIRDFLKIYAGCGIEEKVFTSKDSSEWEISQFNLFNDLYKLTKEFKNNNWGCKLPFAFDPGGWHFCLSFDNDTFGKIIINRWTDHLPENQFVIIADNFEEFIIGLKKYSDEIQS